MKPPALTFARRAPLRWLLALALGGCGSGLAAPADPGRLFYTPAQRAQLESARSRDVATPAGLHRKGVPATGPQRLDGVLIRSDGRTTHWVNGRPQAGAAGVAGLKPGQVRAGGRVYEPYQVLPPAAEGGQP